MMLSPSSKRLAAAASCLGSVAVLLSVFTSCSSDDDLALHAPVETDVVAEALNESTATLAASADTLIRRTTQDKNYGSGAQLDLERSLIKFDSAALDSALAPGDYLVSASLEVTLAGPPGRTRFESAYRLSQDWSEAGATWNCAVDSVPGNNRRDCDGASRWNMTGLPPAPWVTSASSTIAIASNQTGVVSFDVTADVREFLSHSVANYGWMLSANAGGEAFAFRSRESGNSPSLKLTVRHCSAALCDDGNACTVEACSADAQCTHSVVADGASCSDGNACTQTDQCVSGSCTGSNPVVCSSSDACHPNTCNPGTGTCAVSDMCSLYASANVPGTLSDHLLSDAALEDGSPGDRFSAFGSAIAYTGVGDLFIATPDRGPADGATSFVDRYYLLDLALPSPGVLVPTLRGAGTLNESAGLTFLGSAAAFDATNSTASRRFDPEGVRVAPNGNFFISDEYGPFLYEFTPAGDRVRALSIPPKFLISNPSATAPNELPPFNASGRQSNRGMEGLAITPDGTRLYGIMQNALIQDGALNASNQRRGINNRILEVTVATGATREFLYQLTDRSYGVSEILAVNDHQFLVLERDGNAGSAAAFKRLYLIDITGATDISSIAALPQTGTPAGVTPVSKTAFIDFLAPEYALAGATFPEKLEGIAFGRDFVDGSHALVVTSDNDGVSTQASRFLVFRVPAASLPGYVTQIATFPDVCGGVNCPATGTCYLTGICNPGTAMCSTPPAASGTTVSDPTPGDCSSASCDGAGSLVTMTANGDVPVDGQQCTLDVCTSGTPSNPPVTAGATCSQNGGTLCDDNGQCVACLVASDCAGADSECSARTCNAGVCGIAFAAAGTPVATQLSGDCKANQCDGSGNMVAAINNSDLPVDSNDCTDDVCSSGIPSHPPAAAGSSCGAGMVCDGAGTCLGCLSAANCAQPMNPECATAICSSGVCGMAYSAAGTVVSSQSSGDCQSNVCDGSGGIAAQASNGDVPVDGNACTNDVCTAGTPSNPNTAAGSACNQSGGVQCDGAGVCVLPTLRLLRVGDGTVITDNSANPEFVEERTTVGALVNTLAMPTTVGGSNRRLTQSRSATSNGALTLSGDGRFLLTAGYDADVGTASVTGTTTTAFNRIVGRINAAGTIDTSTRLTTAFNTDNVRSAVSQDGSVIWVGGNGSGSTAGVFAINFGSAGGEVRVLGASAPSNVRWVNVANGQLFGSASSGAFTNVFTIGTGLPTTAGQTATALSGMPTSGASPYGYVFFDLNGSVAGVDTLYVADDTNSTTGRLQKWTKSAGGTWTRVASFGAVSTGTSPTAFRAVTGYVSGGNVVLFATSAESSSTPNRLIAYVDDGVNTNPTGSSIAAAGSNQVYRGVALSPHP